MFVPCWVILYFHLIFDACNTDGDLWHLAYEYVATYKSLEILQPSRKFEVSDDAKKAGLI